MPAGSWVADHILGYAYPVYIVIKYLQLENKTNIYY